MTRGLPANWIFSSLTSYFTEPWCLALFHDRFIDLRKELRQILASKEVRVINGYVGYSLQIIKRLYCWSFRLFPTFPLYGFTLRANCTSCKQTMEHVHMMVIFREHGLSEGQISFSLFTNSCIFIISWQSWLKTGYELCLLALRSGACIPLVYSCSPFIKHVCTCYFEPVQRSHQMSKHTSPTTKTSLSKQHRLRWKWGNMSQRLPVRQEIRLCDINSKISGKL